MASTIEFWAAKHFDFADAINEEIWRLSPDLQSHIHSHTELSLPGAIGAQQGMLHNAASGRRGPLPWVPDLVGKDWRDESGVMIVGAAYAGFIEEYSTRSAAMPLARYLAASSVPEFQRDFLSYVVQRDAGYYGPLHEMCVHLGSASRLSLVDLCRVSLVSRGVGDTSRSDSSSSRVINRDPAAFGKYAENPQAAEWLWRRIVSGRARCVVALGFTPEHGLLRLFAKRGMRITEGDTPWLARRANAAWTTKYADPARQIGYWLERGTWWTVQGEVDGANRTWFVLPVYHPAWHAKHDPGYRRTAELLKQMLVAAPL